MTYKLLVILHTLGAAIWVGGHVALVVAVLPVAMRERAPERIREFEHRYGRVAIAALLVQIATGLWLTTHWISDWATVFSNPTPASHIILTKIVLLLVTAGLAVHAMHRVLPRMTPDRMRPFAAHATGHHDRRNPDARLRRVDPARRSGLDGVGQVGGRVRLHARNQAA